MNDGKIEVLVAEDSPAIRMLLVHLLESDPRIRVAGCVGDGQAALEFVQNRKPDVVLMDLHMPRLDGLQATRRIMESRPLPIVLCTASADPKDLLVGFLAMEAGAIACIEKPLGRERSDFPALVANLLETLKVMAEVKVVRRSARFRPDLPPPPLPAPGGAAREIQVVGIGASTGGPQALQVILSGLAPDFPAPLLVVQHIAAGFLPGMIEWLSLTSGLPIQIAAPGTRPRPGHVYFAPDQCQMGVDAEGGIVLDDGKTEPTVRPSVGYLFRSLSDRYGAGVLGVLLTGMGRDGAADLKIMKDRGAITIAQDRDSSVIHGMPGAAIALGAATHVLAVDRIAAALMTLVIASLLHKS